MSEGVGGSGLEGELPQRAPDVLPQRPLPPHAESYPRVELPRNASIHILFTRHHEAADLGEVKPDGTVDMSKFTSQVRGSDIVIPEAAEWEDSDLQVFNKVAKGDQKIRERAIAFYQDQARRGVVGAGFNEAVVRALYASQSQVLYVDLPKGHPDAGDPYIPVARLPIQGTFEEGLARVDTAMRKAAEQQRRREIEIIKNLGEKLPDAITRHPKLKDKPKVPVLMWLGKIHTPIVEALRNYNGDQITSEYTKEQQPDIMRDAIARYVGGEIDQLPEEVRRLTQGRILGEIAASTALPGIGIDLSKYTQDEIVARTASVVEPLSFSQLGELYTAIAQNQRTNPTALNFLTKLRSAFTR